MASEWREVRLGDQIRLRGGLSYKSEFVDKGDALLIGMGAVSYTERFLPQSVRRYGGSYTKVHLVEPGDLVIATRQQSDNLPILGFPAMIPNSLKGCNIIVATNLYKVENGSSISNRFLYWLLKSKEYRERILECAKGTTVRMLTKDAIEDFHFLCPPANERDAIADLLDLFDNKIELNRKMNETLEAMARALFKSWFVDFDPVRAKAEGRPTGLPNHISALFPDSFEDSELGEIPKGWSIKTIDEIFRLVMGQSPPGDTYNEQNVGMPFYQGRTDFGPRFPTRRMYCTAPTRLAEKGDTLVSVRAPVGSINMAYEKCCIGRGVASVRHKGNCFSYTFYAMQSLQHVFRTFEAEGTVFGSISKKDFHTIEISDPGSDIIAAFEYTAACFDQRIFTNTEESRTLTAIRDVLLPKLISGEIRVGQAEQLAGSVL